MVGCSVHALSLLRHKTDAISLPPFTRVPFISNTFCIEENDNLPPALSNEMLVLLHSMRCSVSCWLLSFSSFFFCFITPCVSFFFFSPRRASTILYYFPLLHRMPDLSCSFFFFHERQYIVVRAFSLLEGRRSHRFLPSSSGCQPGGYANLPFLGPRDFRLWNAFFNRQ